ncbi:MAG: PIN domain-containing protein [Chloracidobacterium sp.]|nr:PIN domain-containing protein [Chloracidobacterium sp.]
MNSLDTSVVLRFLLNDVPVQTAKARVLLSKPKTYVTDAVVSEAAFVLERGMGFERSHTAILLRTLIAVPGLNYNEYLLPEVIELFEGHRKLSFIDCYAAVEARLSGASLYTFDRKLLHQGGQHVVMP